MWILLHVFGIHKLMFHHTTGVNTYYQCSICGKREVFFSQGYYQPTDKAWLNHEFTSFSLPPNDECNIKL